MLANLEDDNIRFSQSLSSIASVIQPLHAQRDLYGHHEGWEYDFTFYGWLSTQTGTVSVGSSSITLSADDFVRDLSWGISAHLEARNNPWTIIIDGDY
ncbi:MAG: hypothetical protein O7C75_02385 [Verrucomicrobia bacterium]|nr:hypothetical protein [Verrucomicrobiota bacterium]